MTHSKGLTLVLIFFLLSCFHAQDKMYAQTNSTNKKTGYLVGGPCEGCEAVFEYGDKKLMPVDTLPDFNRSGPKLKLTGTIYLKDGKTPAPDAILYIYHTNQKGLYETRGDEKGWARRHGRIRGWIKTGADGRYTFYTLKPGTYPDRSEPAHVHPIILEPNGKYYWLGSYFFEDDPLLTARDVNSDSPRGGSYGVMSLKKTDGIWVGQRNIILGSNIPDYE